MGSDGLYYGTTLGGVEMSLEPNVVTEFQITIFPATNVLDVSTIQMKLELYVSE